MERRLGVRQVVVENPLGCKSYTRNLHIASPLTEMGVMGRIGALNNKENRKFKISVNVVCAYYDPEKPSSIDELMADANKLMCETEE